jgi:hypothetical protein
MSETKFTPGPWKVFSSEGEDSEGREMVSICWDRGDYENDSDHQCVATAYVDDEELGMANAHLIAAAPVLYEALAATIHTLTVVCDEEALGRAMTALAKARGELGFQRRTAPDQGAVR